MCCSLKIAIVSVTWPELVKGLLIPYFWTWQLYLRVLLFLCIQTTVDFQFVKLPRGCCKDNLNYILLDTLSFYMVYILHVHLEVILESILPYIFLCLTNHRLHLQLESKFASCFLVFSSKLDKHWFIFRFVFFLT